jgi:hypothetical protein
MYNKIFKKSFQLLSLQLIIFDEKLFIHYSIGSIVLMQRLSKDSQKQRY